MKNTIDNNNNNNKNSNNNNNNDNNDNQNLQLYKTIESVKKNKSVLRKSDLVI